MSNPCAEEIKRIADFLGDERIERLKDTVIEMLIDNCKESINEYYLFADFTQFVDELQESVSAELKKKYKKVMTEQLSKKIDEYLEGLKNV